MLNKPNTQRSQEQEQGIVVIFCLEENITYYDTSQFLNLGTLVTVTSEIRVKLRKRQPEKKRVLSDSKHVPDISYRVGLGNNLEVPKYQYKDLQNYYRAGVVRVRRLASDSFS